MRTAGFLVVLWGVAAGWRGETKPRPDAIPKTVVFVCEHGNVKSLIAREWFNRQAARRGLTVRAVSRGLQPATPVPPAIAEELRRDGFHVAGFEARALTAADLAGAARVVAIGIEPSALGARADLPIDTWEGIPPASEQYSAARDALRARIESLLSTLAREERGP